MDEVGNKLRSVIDSYEYKHLIAMTALGFALVWIGVAINQIARQLDSVEARVQALQNAPRLIGKSSGEQYPGTIK